MKVKEELGVHLSPKETKSHSTTQEFELDPLALKDIIDTIRTYFVVQWLRIHPLKQVVRRIPHAGEGGGRGQLSPHTATRAHVP